MLCKISQTLVLAITVIILAIQVRNGHFADLTQCKEKLLEQAKNFNFSQIPNCYNASKLVEAKNYTNVFGGLLQTVSEECKRPTVGNFRMCLSNLLAYLNNHTEEFQTSIEGGISAIFDGAKDCVDVASQHLSNLDQYIGKGCSDN